jgi:excisionase family DNA binding protein
VNVLTVPEAAAILRVGPKAVRKLCRLGAIPHRIVDGRGTLRIAREALDQYLLRQRTGGGR